MVWLAFIHEKEVQPCVWHVHVPINAYQLQELLFFLNLLNRLTGRWVWRIVFFVEVGGIVERLNFKSYDKEGTPFRHSHDNDRSFWEKDFLLATIPACDRVKILEASQQHSDQEKTREA